MKVKICGLTRIEDVEKAVEFGADALGFIFEPSTPRYVCDRENWEEVIRSAPLFIPTVGVYGSYRSRKDPCHLVQAVKYQDIAEAHRSSLSQPVFYVSDPRPGLFVFRFPEGEDTLAARNEILDLLPMSHVTCRALLIDAFSTGAYGGIGEKSNWRVAAALVRELREFPLILAGGLSPDNVADAIEAVNPYGVDVSSGIESSPGVKDHSKMRDFIQAAKGL